MVSRVPLPGGSTAPSWRFRGVHHHPFHGAIAESMNLGKRLYTRVGYDDINETFWNKASVEKMLTMERWNASSGYAKYRQFLRSAGAAAGAIDASPPSSRRLSTNTTAGEWSSAFHHMFTFLSIALHLLVVHAFTGFRRPLFAFAAVTAAFRARPEIHALFIHGNEMLWSRRMNPSGRVSRQRTSWCQSVRRRLRGRDGVLHSVRPVLHLHVPRDCRLLPSRGAKDRSRLLARKVAAISTWTIPRISARTASSGAWFS